MIQKLHAILHDLAARRQRQRFNAGLALTWWLGLVIGLSLWKMNVPFFQILLGFILCLFISTIVIFIWSRRGLGDPRMIAKQIEKKHPALQTSLLAALDQTPDSESGKLSFLQNRVILDSLASAERDHWFDLVPRPRITLLRALHLAGAAACFLTALILLFSRTTKPQNSTATFSQAPFIGMAIDPGDVEIERGSPLTIQVRFAANPPETTVLEITDESGIHTMPLSRPFTDPIYQARLAAVPAPMTYRVLTPDGASRSYGVRVFEIPALEQSEVVLHFPEHLGKPPEILRDPRSIQAIERTRMELTLISNMPGLVATLVAKDHQPLVLTIDPTAPTRHTLSQILTESIRYEIVLTDGAGRRNKRQDILDIKVIPNKPPVVEVVLPRKNDKVTPLQEVRLEARITDEAAILGYGLRYSLDGKNWQEITASAPAGEKRPQLSQLIDLEAAKAKPNDILMWNAWAEDSGPDGKTRRVTGDLHLVQVRNFDEEFYQTKGGGSGGKGAKLIEVQTKILNSSWSLRRDHLEISNTPPKPAELETLHRSQEMAIDMAKALEAKETDIAVKRIITDARLAMAEASTHLAAAHATTSAAPIEPAIEDEQTALRHLYQLMSFKTEISEGEGEPSSSEEKPKEDLDLKPLENPYKDEKQAKPEASQAATEAMEILKRLDELAKRQRDLNEEMKSLQLAMQQADTPEKRAEVERQLKQLREQQRELLADIGKLQEKNPEATPAEQQQALAEAREKAQQAKEKLDEKKLGDALAAGHRAQDSLEKLHNDFREASAAKLAGQLRDLRQDARALEERQHQLTNNTPPPPESKPLRLSEKPTSAPDLTNQRQGFEKLTEALQQTAQTAERAEPLVAKDLDEALREADHNGIAQALENLETGTTHPSDPAATKATQDLAKLTRDIENAAERILGNEAQALRYARDELARLTQQASAKPGQPASPSDQGTQPGGKNIPGEGQAPGQGEKPGEGEGQSQASGKKPGEGQGQGPGQGERNGEGQGQGSAISGQGYEQWRDRMADLEAILTDPDAQSAVARARKASLEMRKDYKRHARLPDQAKIDQAILHPLNEAAKALDARLNDLDQKDPLAPVGRDPVPERYTEIVRQYFEELGK